MSAPCGDEVKANLERAVQPPLTVVSHSITRVHLGYNAFFQRWQVFAGPDVIASGGGCMYPFQTRPVAAGTL